MGKDAQANLSFQRCKYFLLFCFLSHRKYIDLYIFAKELFVFVGKLGELFHYTLSSRDRVCGDTEAT